MALPTLWALAAPAHAQPPAFLVRDINTVPVAVGSAPALLVQIGATTFFAAWTPQTGYELWKSDGTEGGTVLVKDVQPGPGSSLPGFFADDALLVDVSGTLYFAADDGVNGGELWKSDGTEAGTVRVKDIQPGPGSSSPGFLVDVSGTLFFAADDGVAGSELWRSDGTEAGTLLVKDIRPGPSGSSPEFPEPRVDVNGTLYFTADDGVTGFELWRSDGTEAGTLRVKDIFTRRRMSSFPYYIVEVKGTLFFGANDGVAGSELWRSDGTEAGTLRVKDIQPGSVGSSPQSLMELDGTLFFTASDGVTGEDLWRSDGTEGGMVRVKDIQPAPSLGPPAGSSTWMARSSSRPARAPRGRSSGGATGRRPGGCG